MEMETITPSTVTKTTEIAFLESASVLDLCTMTEKETYGYIHHFTILTLFVVRTLDYLDG